MGTLSPDADRDTMGQVMELAIEDARGRDIEQYRVQQIVQQVEDTIYEFPFRLPRDLALVLRVATVVEGVCVQLDPDFDFIRVATDFLTERGYREESARQFVEEVRGDVVAAAQSSIRVPQTLERVLHRAERGNLAVQSDLRDSHDVLDRLARRLVAGMVLAASLLATAYLYPLDGLAAAVPAAVGVFSAVVLYRSFRERRGFRAQPQFTRQAMRERREEE
jgi:predicted unusual protein kinase regulating ubiquinone biosynthesis (AarF/ABC1/UbiB family)